MQLVTRIPKKGANCRLSHEEIFPIDDRYYSIRDCAEIAVEKAVAAQDMEAAGDYEEKAAQLCSSYDARISKKIERTFSQKTIKYMLISLVCIFFSVLMTIFYRMSSGSFGILFIVILTFALSVGSMGIAIFLLFRKKKILSGNGGFPERGFSF